MPIIRVQSHHNTEDKRVSSPVHTSMFGNKKLGNLLKNCYEKDLYLKNNDSQSEQIKNEIELIKPKFVKNQVNKTLNKTPERID